MSAQNNVNNGGVSHSVNNAIIDIGSNSVRIMVYSGGKILLRDLVTTQLAEGLSDDKKLAYKSINRTIQGISELKREAEALGETRFYCFATAAVRNAANGNEFCGELYNRLGLTVDVLSGEKEAAMGLYGALRGADGLVIDVGGGSTELVVAKNGKIVYAESAPCGAVVLGDNCPRNKNAALNLAENALESFDFCALKQIIRGDNSGGASAFCNLNGGVAEADKKGGLKAFGIGGTANSLAFISLGGGVYDRAAQDGFVLKTEALGALLNEFFECSAERLSQKYNLNLRRARVLPFGAALLYSVAQALCLSKITLSEGDNLEGYMCFLNGEKLYER